MIVKAIEYIPWDKKWLHLLNSVSAYVIQSHLIQVRLLCCSNFSFHRSVLLQITECVVRSEDRQYDLTSLVRTTDNWEAQSDGGKFYINVCRSLNLGPLVSGCSGTASICLKKDDGRTFNLGKWLPVLVAAIIWQVSPVNNLQSNHLEGEH